MAKPVMSAKAPSQGWQRVAVTGAQKEGMNLCPAKQLRAIPALPPFGVGAQDTGPLPSLPLLLR